MYRLTTQDPSSELEWLDEIPRPVSDEDWARTGLRCWNTTEVADAKEFLGVIGRFKALTNHLSGVLALTGMDGADHEVLQGYLDRYQSEWSEIIQAFIDGIRDLAERYNQLTIGEQEQRSFLAEAAFAARDHIHDWLPPGLDAGQAVLSVDVCA
jgi:hypothetical protein